jgi:hypothetical protein
VAASALHLLLAGPDAGPALALCLAQPLADPAVLLLLVLLAQAQLLVQAPMLAQALLLARCPLERVCGACAAAVVGVLRLPPPLAQAAGLVEVPRQAVAVRHAPRPLLPPS